MNLARLEKLVYKSGKVLLNVPYDTSNYTVIQNLNWLLPAERLLYHRSIIMFKCLNSLCPTYITEKFENPSHHYNTRQSQHLKLTKCKTNYGQRTFQFCGAKTWNSLPKYIQDAETIYSFKSNLLKHIFSKRQ